MQPSAAVLPTVVPPPSLSETALLDLSVIIVNYNVREFLEQSLRSIERAAQGLDVEVFVVDNNSVDGSVEMVRAQFPNVHVIANDYNAGFSKANNQAIIRARGRHLLILNPDTIVQEDTFRALLTFMERTPDAGAVGCMILNPDGTFAPESRRAFPTPAVALYRMAGLSRLFPRSRRFARYNLSYLPQDETAEVDALSGSCMLVRRAALYYGYTEACTLRGQGIDPDVLPLSTASTGAGLLDEDFFMYGEDLDWCYRIQQAGWKIFYTPETRIIHFKGESTKKGELRYVRLFYGAMLRFAEKHFTDRYSRLFAWVLHAGIAARAALTIGTSALRRGASPLLDFVLVFGLVVGLGLIRSAEAGNALSGFFVASVAPVYALAVVAGIALSGGYRRGHAHRLRPVLAGASLGLVVVAAASFFLKAMAFSRAVVLVCYPLAAAVLALRRAGIQPRDPYTRRAVLVGPAFEAERLQRMLHEHPAPAMELLGYIEPNERRRRGKDPQLARLGTLLQLRDLVRLRRVDDVIFAGAGLSNQSMLDLMQQLRDLPVQFKILAEGGHHVIGKASIASLALPSVLEVDGALGPLEHRATRRVFELAASVIGLLLYPAVGLYARFSSNGRYRRLAARLRQLTDVLAGRKALVGYATRERACVAPALGIKPGVFAVTESLPVLSPGTKGIARVYWSYAINRSASLDLDIMLGAIRNLVR